MILCSKTPKNSGRTSKWVGKITKFMAPDVRKTVPGSWTISHYIHDGLVNIRCWKKNESRLWSSWSRLVQALRNKFFTSPACLRQLHFLLLSEFTRRSYNLTFFSSSTSPSSATALDLSGVTHPICEPAHGHILSSIGLKFYRKASIITLCVIAWPSCGNYLIHYVYIYNVNL